MANVLVYHSFRWIFYGIQNFSIEDTVIYRAMKYKVIQALEKLEFLKQYTGIQVDDHETALYHFGTCYGECNIHLLRYLKKNTEEIGNQWSKEMTYLLCEINREQKRLLGQGILLFPEEALSGYEQREQVKVL